MRCNISTHITNTMNIYIYIIYYLCPIGMLHVSIVWIPYMDPYMYTYKVEIPLT